jgi:hypothetical protein
MTIQEHALSIQPALQCSSLDGWYPVTIGSASNEDVSYTVHVNPWANRSEQHVCECKSYHYRGNCKHQKQAHEQHCGWNEIEGPEEPKSEDGQIVRECPRCGETATWAMWETNG